MAEIAQKNRIRRICSDKSASQAPEIHLVWMGEMLEKPRFAGVPLFQTSNWVWQLPIPNSILLQDLGNCLRRWSENGSWRAIFWRMDGDFPAIFSCWSIPGGVYLGAHPVSKPCVPRKKPSCVRKSQRQRDARQRVAGPTKEFTRNKASCVRKSQRQRDARQRVAGPTKEFTRNKASCVRKSQCQRDACQTAAGPKKGLHKKET